MSRWTYRALVASVAWIAAVACTSESPAGPGPVGPPPPPELAATPLECEEKGYPCSFSEVPLEILERTDELGDEARAMLEAGASPDQVAGWLGEQSDVSELDWDELAIRFRLEGGRGMWLYRETESQTGTAAVQPHHAAVALPSPAPYVVGSGTEEKRALILSPFFWQFPGEEDGKTVAAILGDTRGYEGRVQFRRNEKQAETAVDLGSFSGWQNYQVIHVSTHGKRLCNDEGCRATIAVGLLDNILPDGPSKAVQLQALEAFGLDVAKRENGPDYLILTADFFRMLYPKGLQDAFIFLTACQSYGPEATDLVEALQGEKSVVFGWDQDVFVLDATATSVALYGLLAGRGYPAEIAYEELGQLRTGAPVRDSPPPQLRLAKRRGGGDMRIRDVVYLLHPSTTELLEEADTVHITGALDDWVRDTVPFLVQVDGVKPQFAGQTRVRVQLDDHWSDYVPVSSGERNERDQWLVSGMAALPYDLEDPEELTFRAEVALHSGGESKDEAPAILTGPLSMGRTWEVESVFTSGPPESTWSANARLTLSFAGENGIDDPSRPFLVTGGSVRGRIDYEEGLCRVTSPTFMYDVPGPGVDVVGMVEFDVSERPVKYWAIVGTTGPPITVTFQCPGIATQVQTRVMLRWLNALPEEGRTTSSDRRNFSDTSREDLPGLVMESGWSARRVD